MSRQYAKIRKKLLVLRSRCCDEVGGTCDVEIKLQVDNLPR
jgi:hypothetical protein